MTNCSHATIVAGKNNRQNRKCSRNIARIVTSCSWRLLALSANRDAATTGGESLLSLFLGNLVDVVTYDVVQLGNIVQFHARPFVFGADELMLGSSGRRLKPNEMGQRPILCEPCQTNASPRCEGTQGAAAHLGREQNSPTSMDRS